MVKKIFFACIFLVGFLALCSSPSNARARKGKLTPSINKLAFEMLQDEEISQRGEDALFSPYSYANPMAALYLGTAGNTKKEFEAAFGFDTRTKFEFKELKKAFDTLPQENKLTDVGRLFANQINNGKLLHSYRDYLANFLRTDLVFLDFSRQEDTADAINYWVNQATKNKITSIVQKDDITPNTSMILVNAIYFKAPWQDPFLKEDIRKLYFHLETEERKNIPFLTKSFDTLAYYEDADCSAVSVPYKGHRLAFMVILPKEGQKMSDFLPLLTVKKFEKMCNGLINKKVDVSFPRFKTESKLDLTNFTTYLVPRSTNAVLANFSNITGKREFYIGSVIQRATIDVSEEGTEASAATAVQMLAMCAPSRNTDKKIFSANRPFIYLVYDLNTHTILFAGKFEKGE